MYRIAFLERMLTLVYFSFESKISLMFKVPLQRKNLWCNFKHNRTTFLDESKWRVQFLTISFRFRDIYVFKVCKLDVS